MGVASHLEVRLLGGFRVAMGDLVLPDVAWRRRQVAAVVKLLALAPGHRLHREQLLETLWPDLDSQDASANLRVVLHRARQQLKQAAPESAAAFLVRDGEVLALGPEDQLKIDVDAFEAAVAAAWRTTDPTTVDAALTHYTGDLLPGDPYADWAESRRAALRASYLTLLRRLAHLHEAHEERGRAIAALQRLVAVESTDEDAQAALIRLLAETGQRDRALAQARHLLRALERELGVTPEATTRELIAAIQDSRFPTAVRPVEAAYPAPLATVGALRGLPTPIDDLIGRDREVAEVRQLLVSGRLVTLTGPGGIGKTRLAIEVAHAIAGEVSDGVAFVDLSPIRNPGLVATTIASTFGLPDKGDQALLNTLTATIGGSRLLLVLDNFEQVVEAAPIIATLLVRCPALRVLVTSRTRLHLRGEWAYPVPPLPVPERAGAPQSGVHPLPIPEELAGFASVTLFVQRARAVRPEFALTIENASAVTDICRRLDGLPLAIELAAARIRALPPTKLLDQLARPLELLTDGPRDLPERQRTLRATIAWSYDLLSPRHQSLFRRLTVFAGGWSPAAAEAVATALGDLDGDVLDSLTALVDHSMVRELMTPVSEPRFGLPETVREFGLEKLTLSGELEPARRAHANYFADLANEIETGLTTEKQLDSLDRMTHDHDNFRLALEWLFAHDQVEQGLRLAVALWWFWWVRGYVTEGRDWLAHGLAARDGVPIDLRVRALHGAGTLAETQGDYAAAVSFHEEARNLCRTIGNERGEINALESLGDIARNQGAPDRAKALFEEVLKRRRAIGDQQGVAYALLNLGGVTAQQGDNDRAMECYGEAIDLLRPLRDQRGIAAALSNLGVGTLLRGDLATASILYHEALGLWREIGDKEATAVVLGNLGEIALFHHDYETATALLTEAYSIFDELGDRGSRALIQLCLGKTALKQDDYATAVPLLLDGLPVVQDLLDQESIAQGLATVAELALLRGKLPACVQLLGASEAVRDANSIPLPNVYRSEFEHRTSAACAAMTDAGFDSEWATGRNLSQADAILTAMHVLRDELLQGIPDHHHLRRLSGL